MAGSKSGSKEYYQKELQRLEKSDLTEDTKRKIKQFLSYGETAKNYSYNRLYFHSQNLRAIAGSMGNTFLNPSAQDVIDALSFHKNRTFSRSKQDNGSSLSEWTLEGYKASLKVFYKWAGKPEIVADLKYQGKGKINRSRKPDFRITPAEFDLLINASDNARDRAIISLLYDSGIRIGELLTLRNRDVLYDDYGLKITVTGKTGTRNVRVIGDSVGYMRAWQNIHPDLFDDDAWLFCGIGHDMRGKTTIKEPMNHSQVYMMLKKVKTRAIVFGFPPGKRINPHKFRHNRATELAPKLPGVILDKVMGWNLDSKMPAVYLHLNDEETDRTVLESQGIEIKEKIIETRRARLCLSCKSPNPSNSKYCIQCGRPLTEESIRDLMAKEDYIQNELESRGMVSPQVKALIENMPESERTAILTSIIDLALREHEKNGLKDE